MDEELDEIRRRKMADLQRQQSQQSAMEQQAQQMDAQKQAILRGILTPEARERLGTVRMAYPDVASMVEDQLIVLAQQGRITDPVSDDLLRQILRKLAPQRREINIERI